MHYGQWVESSATRYQSPHIRRRRSVHHEHTVSGQPQTRLLRATIQNIIYSRNKQRRLNFCLLLFFFSKLSLRDFANFSPRGSSGANNPIRTSIHPSIHTGWALRVYLVVVQSSPSSANHHMGKPSYSIKLIIINIIIVGQFSCCCNRVNGNDLLSDPFWCINSNSRGAAVGSKEKLS